MIARTFPRTTRRPPTRPAFSMLELMISIMILGLGLVMVATVFPVTMTISRDTLQMSISLAAADAAQATVQLRVPTWMDMNNDSDISSQYPAADADMLAPDMLLKVLLPNVFGIESDAQIGSTEYSARFPSPPNGTCWGSEDWGLWTYTPTAGQAQVIAASRVYTEATGWRADLSTSTDLSAVLSSQTVFANGALGTEQPPVLLALAGSALEPRTHVVDRVYPPVPVTNPSDNSSRLDVDILRDLEERRYAWTAIHRKSPLKTSMGAFLLTIAVTHRPDLNARYAKEADPPLPAMGFDPTGTVYPNHPALLRTPTPDAAATDALFPQAWLVMFDSVDPTQGQIGCTSAVARLLPADSFFIEAQGQNAGTARRVLSNSLDPSDTTSTSAVLQIPRSTSVQPVSLLVWVFPPPIVSRGTPSVFGTRSPVVGVFIREVTAQ